jgi:hypothetical protein
MEQLPELLKAAIKILEVAWNLAGDEDFEKAIEIIERDILDLAELVQAAVDLASGAGPIDY